MRRFAGNPRQPDLRATRLVEQAYTIAEQHRSKEALREEAGRLGGDTLLSG